MHRERRKRGFDDDDFDSFSNRPRVSYRKPPGEFQRIETPGRSPAAEAVFAERKVSESGNSDTSKPAARGEPSPAVKCYVKFYNATKHFGILRTSEGPEFFLPGRVLPAGVGAEQLQPATELLVRVAPDKGKELAVTEVIEIKPAALRTEIGTVVRWNGSYGFVELDCGGQFVYLARRCVTEAGLDPSGLMGARVEVDATVHHKPAAVAVRKL